jgi:glyoxylase-like metal-dependent hydrolase (beta-lactamase superfamily II)
VGPDVSDVQAFFGLNSWPDGVAQLDLGGRLLEITPVPGHHQAGIALYDSRTGFLLTGDFLLPGRIYIDDTGAFRASSRRLQAFAAARPVFLVLGGHLEMDSEGGFYRPGATHHPGERDLHLLPQDVEGLAVAADSLARYLPYRAYANFALVNYEVMLPALGVLLLALAFLLALGWRFIRNRRRR